MAYLMLQGLGEQVVSGRQPVLAALQVLVAHGRLDQVIPVDQGRLSHKLLGSLPLDLTYMEYEMGHEISQECLRDLRNWLGRRL